MSAAPPVLVTGASGFIGWHVVRALSQAGFAVRALVRPASDVRHLRALGPEIFVGDVLQADTLVEPARGVGAVVHLAGALQAPSEEAHRQVHVDGTMNLLDALARPGGADLRRFVFVSSLAAAGPAEGPTPIDETAAPRPVGAYGRTKLEAEAAVLERKGRHPVTIFRPPLVYGPRDRSLLPYFQAVRAGLMFLPAGGEQRLSLIHGADLAAAVVRAITWAHPSGSIFHLADGPARRLRDIAEAVRLAQGTPALPFVISRRTLVTARKLGRTLLRWFPAMPGWMHPDSMDLLLAPSWNCSDAAIRNALQWAPALTLVEGLAGTVQWYREAGWLLRPWGGSVNRRELRPSKAPLQRTVEGKEGSR